MEFVDGTEATTSATDYDNYCMVCQSTTVTLQPVESYKPEFPNELSLREKLRELSRHEIAPSASICNDCSYRTFETWDFKQRLENTNAKNSLGFKIRMLRQKLREMTEKADVFIVVGKNGDSLNIDKGNTLMVDKDLLNSTAEDEYVDDGNMCNRCTETLANMTELLAHKEQHGDDDPYICHRCQFIFTEKEMYDAHIDVHKSYSCNVCGFSGTTSKEYGEHVCVPKCVACNKEYPNRNKLTDHVRDFHNSRSGTPPYICSVCFKRFPSVELMEQHRHREPKTHFVCGYNNCLTRFEKKDQLMKHVRTVHSVKAHKTTTSEVKQKKSSERKGAYRCKYSTCLMEFPKQMDLFSHQAEEHGYVCAECGAWFSFMRTRNRHIKSKHPMATVPPANLNYNENPNVPNLVKKAAQEEVASADESELTGVFKTEMLQEQDVEQYDEEHEFVDSENVEYLDESLIEECDTMEVEVKTE